MARLGFNIAFVGLSKRYLVLGETNGSVDVQLQAKLIGDACRLRWRFTNIGTETAEAGLRFGLSPSMATTGQTDSQSGATLANVPFGSLTKTPKDVDNYVGFTYLPTRRPLRTEHKRDSLDVDFPDYVTFGFGQTNAYGIKLENRPNLDILPDANTADQIVIGNHGVILDGGMSDVLFGDATGGTLKDNDIKLNFTSVIQRYPQRSIPAGGSVDIVHYVRSTWSVADYVDPYTVVLDAPRLVNFPGGGTNNQSPNPMQIRVWIDNQFATIDREVPLNNVSVTLTLPDGLDFVDGENPVKFISFIAPNDLVPIDFFVESDGETFGDLPISVDVTSLPGPSKELNTTIRVSAAPTISMTAGPNMLTFPYNFGDNALDQILGLVSGVDYNAYTWNSSLGTYEPVTSVQRGVGYWVIPTDDQNSVQLQNAGLPTDTAAGGLLGELEAGLEHGWQPVQLSGSFERPDRGCGKQSFGLVDLVGNGSTGLHLLVLDFL